MLDDDWAPAGSRGGLQDSMILSVLGDDISGSVLAAIFLGDQMTAAVASPPVLICCAHISYRM
eukprot:4661380-Heterocapsa_arctica.AAC.1